MGNKKKKTVQLLSNPMTNPVKAEQKHLEELKKLLREKLSNLYPNSQVSSAEIISELSETDKVELFKLPRKERAKKLKSYKILKREEISSTKTMLPSKFKNGLVLGLKKCLKQLESKTLNALIYDSEVNIDALKCLFDKGDLPMIPIPGVSTLIRELLGFPALCFGFPKNLNDVDIETHFKPILEICSILKPQKEVLNEVKSEKESPPLPDVIPKVKRKSSKLAITKVTLLKRNSKSERIFDPSNCDDNVENEDEKEAFQGDFISFTSKPAKRKKENSSVTYKKAKMELLN